MNNKNIAACQTGFKKSLIFKAIGSGYEGASMLFARPVNNPLFINQEPQGAHRQQARRGLS